MLSHISIKNAVMATCIFFAYNLLSDPVAEAQNILKLSPLSDESYAENFTLVARLENNDYLLVQAMIMNGGVGDEKPACRILYVSSDGHSINEVNRGDDWSYQKRLDKVRIGTCLLQRTANGLTWKAKTESISAELSLQGKTKRFNAKNMHLNSKDGSFESHIIMPRAEVLARIKHKGKQNRKLKGIGLVNHARSTILPPKLAKRWFKLYAFAKNPSSSMPKFLLLDIRYPPQKAKPQAWVWESSQSNPKNIKLADPFLSQNLAKKSLKKGDHFTLSAHDSSYRIRHLKPMFRYEPIKAYGLMGRMLKSWIGDPINQSSLVEIETPNGIMIGMVEEVLFR